MAYLLFHYRPCYRTNRDTTLSTSAISASGFTVLAFGCSLLFGIVVVVSSMAAVHKQMHQRTQQNQKSGQNPSHVYPVFANDEKRRDPQETKKTDLHR